jgi:hypothetical protein
MIARLFIAGLILICSGLFSPAEAAPGCRYPFVWREAFAGDYVCVKPSVRAQAQRDNAAAFDRVNPTNHDYGPDTCRYGYVWREASPSDHVCVKPEIRAQAAFDNSQADQRWASSAPDPAPPQTGSYNPAWQAAPGDHSCCPKNMLVCPLGRNWCKS